MNEQQRYREIMGDTSVTDLATGEVSTLASQGGTTVGDVLDMIGEQTDAPFWMQIYSKGCRLAAS